MQNMDSIMRYMGTIMKMDNIMRYMGTIMKMDNIMRYMGSMMYEIMCMGSTMIHGAWTTS